MLFYMTGTVHIKTCQEYRVTCPYVPPLGTHSALAPIDRASSIWLHILCFPTIILCSGGSSAVS